jgi:hypothetical protein
MEAGRGSGRSGSEMAKNEWVKRAEEAPGGSESDMTAAAHHRATRIATIELLRDQGCIGSCYHCWL